eukprot:gene5882-11332_t
MVFASGVGIEAHTTSGSVGHGDFFVNNIISNSTATHVTGYDVGTLRNDTFSHNVYWPDGASMFCSQQGCSDFAGWQASAAPEQCWRIYHMMVRVEGTGRRQAAHPPAPGAEWGSAAADPALPAARGGGRGPTSRYAPADSVPRDGSAALRRACAVAGIGDAGGCAGPARDFAGRSVPSAPGRIDAGAFQERASGDAPAR